jgi:hypothetical protein
MTKKSPTLADAAVRMLSDKATMGAKNAGPQWVPVRELIHEIVRARKFILDKDMSAYLADISQSFWQRGGLRKRNHALDNARRMARLPHHLTWIEFDYRAYLDRKKTKWGYTLHPVGRAVYLKEIQWPNRLGWLVQQHPKLEIAFRATEVRSGVQAPDYQVWPSPLSHAWCSDDTPLPWRSIFPGEDHAAAGIVNMEGYRSSQVAFVCSYSEQMTADWLTVMKGDDDPRACRPMLDLRDLWGLLATINDLPVRVDHVEPSRGFFSRGVYKKFLQHSIVHLTVPETRWRALINKTATMLRRRAHQVRGHWRKDWRNPLSPLCEHEFDDDMICQRCQGRKLWIGEHERGDASLGFVTHDYTVTKQ